MFCNNIPVFPLFLFLLFLSTVLKNTEVTKIFNFDHPKFQLEIRSSVLPEPT